jgi:hypothetical protein
MKPSVVVAAMLSVAVFALPASAQEKPAPKPQPKLPWHDVEFRVGLFSGSFRSGVETTNDLGTGFSINLEDTLDLDDTKLAYRLETSVALGQRHRIHFDYLNVFREGEKNVEREIEIGNTVFPVGAHVESESSFQLITLTYGYSIVQDERMDLQLTFGIHGMRSELELEADVLTTAKSVNVFLPIPLPGLRFDAVLSPGVWLRQRLDFIWLKVGDYAGLMADYGARLEIEVSKGFSVGFGFNTLNAHVEAQDDDNPGIGHKGSVDYSFSGMLLYLGYGF